MKFTEKLNAHLTPEWRQQYITYAVSIRVLLMILLNVTGNSFVINY